MIRLYFASNAAPLLYIILAACDLFSGCIALIHTGFIYYILSGEYQDDDELWLLPILYIATAVTTSIYYNVILAVIRTINILKPFYFLFGLRNIRTQVSIIE